jgi:hypothetical protein
MTTRVLQSQSPAAVSHWQRQCLDSVKGWAASQGFEYHFLGDELFAKLPHDLREKFAAQPVVLADLARLRWLQEALDAGCERAIWCDADVLVFRDFTPGSAGHAFGRELWVQPGDKQGGASLRCWRKIHNAYLQFGAGDATLPFYLQRAEALLRRVEAPVVPQFIGPKLLTALHNVLQFTVEERIGMLSPLVMRDLLAGGGPALELLRRKQQAAPCALNLCASYVGREADGVRHGGADYERVVARLLRDGL